MLGVKTRQKIEKSRKELYRKRRIENNVKTWRKHLSKLTWSGGNWIYKCDKPVDEEIRQLINVISQLTILEQASNSLFEWFKNNLLKSNDDKCNLLVSTNDRVSMNVDGFKIDKSDTEKLLGVKFDKKTDF